MALDRALPEFTALAEGLPRRYASLASARAASAADVKVNLALAHDYQVYLRRYAEFALDPAGPGRMIDILEGGRRIVVEGTLIAVTDQIPRVTAWLAGLGASVSAQEDDTRIGVSRLTVDSLDPQQAYAALRQSRLDVAAGELPLEVSLDDVTYQNGVTFKPITPQSGSGGAHRISLSRKRPQGTGRGAGITVAVIDGGFDPDNGRTDGWTDNVIPPTDGRPRLDNQNPGTLDPGAGHGSFVTGVVIQRAPDVTVRQYRAVDSFGFGSSWRLKDCLLQAVADGAQIVNISLGFEDPDLLGSPALSAALHTIPSTVLVVASAGNSGTAIPMLPAAHKATIGVGGLEADLDPVAWSNFGPWVDFSAIAIPVTSTYVADPADPAADPNPWAVWAGTSFSAPKVTGELAALLSTGLSADEAVATLRTMVVGPHPSPDYGYLLDLADDLDRTAFDLAFPDPTRVWDLRRQLRIPPRVLHIPEGP